jgi:bacterioferritin-associated ferredoxin
LDDSTSLGNFPIHRVRILKDFPQTQLVSIAIPKGLARKAVGIRAFKTNPPEPMELYHKKPLPDEIIVCRCERVTAGEIRDLIKKGITDVNQIKAITRAGMGACGAKTCGLLIDRLFREEGISQDKITEGVKRPLFIEVPLKYFASVDEGDEK